MWPLPYLARNPKWSACPLSHRLFNLAGSVEMFGCRITRACTIFILLCLSLLLIVSTWRASTIQVTAPPQVEAVPFTISHVSDLLQDQLNTNCPLNTLVYCFPCMGHPI